VEERVSALYNEIAALDAGIANRWKTLSKDNPNYKMTASDIDVIVGPLVGPKVIFTEKQAEAIVKLFQGPGVTREALNELTVYVQKAEKSLGFEAKPLKGNDLKFVYSSLKSPGIHRISFTSPGTTNKYMPNDYLTIADLIALDTIAVFEFQASDLYKVAIDSAYYLTNKDAIFIFHRPQGASLTLTVIHETTHAILNFRGVGAQRRFIEADAYLAGAMAATVYNEKSAYFEGEISSAAFYAARWALLMNDPSKNDNPKAVSRHFEKSYGELADAVDRSYPDSKQFETNSDQNKGARLGAFKAYRQMEDFLEFAQDSLLDTFRIEELRDGITKALP
jgi:hypothetical protein